MLKTEDIENLARLARIKLTQIEEKKLLTEIEPILGYVAQLREVTSVVSEEKKSGEHKNITREDINPTESGKNTKAILHDMPEIQDNYLKVKKIL